MRPRNGGIAIHPNPDTANWAGVLLVHIQGLAGLDVPHPEWRKSVLKQWKRSGSEKPGRTIKRARYGGIAIKAIPPFFKENLGYDPEYPSFRPPI